MILLCHVLVAYFPTTQQKAAQCHLICRLHKTSFSIGNSQKISQKQA